MKTQYLTLSEGKIAYDDQGSGPLVVCVPGIGDLRSQFRFLVPQLVEAGYRVVTMDNRGHGESSVGWQGHSVVELGSDILALIRHLDAGPAVVVGHSMGAGSAVWAAAEVPDLVRALVLVGPAVHGDPGLGMRLMMSVLFTRPWGPGMWTWYYNKLYPSRKPADWENYTSAIRQNLAQPGRMEALQAMMFASKAASEARLGQVKAPAFIVMGSQDPDFKPEIEARWVADQLSGQYVMIEGAGHYPHAEMPEISGPKIVAFLASLQTEEAHAAR